MILITGASGFLGRHLVRQLSSQGLQVRALYHTHAPDSELANLPGISWMQCDLLDIFAVEEAMKDVTEVYHCAAIVTFDPEKKDEMLHFNPTGTEHIVNQALEQGIRKMVYVSSIAALGRAADLTKEITEEEEWNESKNNSVYAVSKFLAEMEVWRGIGEGLNAVIVNPGIILGAGHNTDLSAQLMKVVYKEFPFYSRGVNSWVDVKDVIDVMVMLMASDITAERYILNGGNHSYKEIFTLMAAALGKKPPHIYATPFMTSIAWRLSAMRSALTGKRSIITRETVKNSNAVCYYNNEKLLKTFPKFKYRSISTTIADMARSFIENMGK